MENIFEVQQIVFKHLWKEVLTEEESAILQRLLSSEGGRELVKSFDNQEWVGAQLAQIQVYSHEADPIWQKIQALLEKENGKESPLQIAPDTISMPRQNRRLLWRNVVAATVILMAGGAFYWGVLHNGGPAVDPIGRASIAVAGSPGGDKAVLTLSDGRQINLDSRSNGAVADQGNVKISKPASGQLTYTTLDGKPIAAAFNTLSTPRAGQFSVSLPDSTKVWLNNASSLRYPVYFAGTCREVELTGEGYFEVAKNAGKPFKVVVRHSGVGEDGGSIEVLGTSFNIMAYPDESTQQTTLVEGSVRIVRKDRSQVLQPAEQSIVDAQGQLETVKHVDVSEVTAWKNGYFHFDHSSLSGTMRQLSRWYDVEVEYQHAPTGLAFTGKIQRNIPLAELLKAIEKLENQRVHFQLEGRKLLVLP